MRLSDQNLQRRTLVAADGLAIGEVAALFLDSEDWKIESLHVKLHNDIADRLGAPHNLFRAGTVEIPVSLIQSVGDAVVLSLDVDNLRQFLAGAKQGAGTSAQPIGGPPPVHH